MVELIVTKDRASHQKEGGSPTCNRTLASDNDSVSTGCFSPDSRLENGKLEQSGQSTRVKTVPMSKTEFEICQRLLQCEFDSDHKHITDFTVMGSSVRLFKKEKQGSRLLQYVASGTMPISAETLMALNLDNEYRSKWDDNSLEMMVGS
eukprot:GHVQ01024824.1.p1 GENE.GHVQ01024824.1~~GHVQ01024824.1.p1  ORF type:complete len:149 (+),score=18.51 GHVQ01024824.1:296-742(+)